MRKFKVSLIESWSDEAFLSVELKAANLVDLIDKVRENEELAEFCYSKKELVEWHCGVNKDGNFPEWDDDMIEGCIYEIDGEVELVLNELIRFVVEEIS